MNMTTLYDALDKTLTTDWATCADASIDTENLYDKLVEAINSNTAILTTAPQNENEKAVAEPEKPVETHLVSEGHVLYCENIFKNSGVRTALLPDIEDIKIFDSPDKEDKGKNNHILPRIVVKMFFADGTTETAVIDQYDYCMLDSLLEEATEYDVEKVTYFLVEQGVSICIMKKLLSMECSGAGGSVYNKLVRYAMKKKKQREADAAREAAERKKAKKRESEKKKEQRRKERAEYEKKVDVLAAALKKAFPQGNG